MIQSKILTTDTTLALGQKKIMQKSLVTTKRQHVPLTYQEKLIGKLEKMVREHLTEHLTIDSLATHVAMSKSGLYRFLKKMTGSTPGRFIRDIRLREAVFLLQSQQYQTISEVVYAVGFEDASSFTRLFKKRFGKSPSTYVKSVSRRNTEGKGSR
ncbi:AraC family transcriptional regulator [Fulvivirgaceae bacterium BMA12]|uniref:AraC family transcriptional regulator n=1 Tax=Agaribacillus aureus TaxID=3051825 RepID=A0ABT8L4X1_9BACT|nr:AraC family transcriptional regulator [Fulvivirgaceae bacterium BMA12]